MAASGGSKEKMNGVRMYLIVKEPARDTLHKVYDWGTPDKDDSVSLTDYKNTLSRNSLANYCRVPAKKCKFNSEDAIITGDPTGRTYDIILLHQLIKLFCDNVAPFDDPKWSSGQDHLESLVTTVKNERNKVCHGELELSDTDFDDRVKKLQEDCEKILKAAKEKFGRSDDELKEEIKKMEDKVLELRCQVLGEEDLRCYRHDVVKNILIAKVEDFVRASLPKYEVLQPLYFLPDNKENVKVENFFTEMLLTKEDQRGTTMKYIEMLTVGQEDPKKPKPQLLLVNGVAGSGKSTLLTLLIREWLQTVQSGPGKMTGLDQYKILLRIQCRDTHLKSFIEFLKNMMQDYSNFRDMIVPAIKTCHIMVLVDGLDELNNTSRNVIDELLDEMQDSPKCTLIMTSRPEAIPNFKRNRNLGKYQVINIELLGIAEKDRSEFVVKYIKEFQPNADTDQFRDILRKVCGREQFRLPLNLVFLAWQCLHDPGSVRVDFKQIEFYDWIHKQTKKKLQERLPNVDEQVMEECLGALYLTMLKALARNQIFLTKEELCQFTTACKNACENKSIPKEVLSALFTMKTIYTPRGDEVQQYSSPHKALQEHLAALHIIKTLKQQELDQSQSAESNNQVQSTIRKAIGVDKVDLTRMKNVLRHSVGLMYVHMSTVPNHLVKEVVDLLHQAGVMEQEDWLDVLEDTMWHKEIVTEIANRFPVNRGIQVRDGRVAAYSVILPYLPPTKVEVRIRGDPSELSTLKHATTRHSIDAVEVDQHWYHPQPNIAADPFLQQVLSKDGLKEFRGQWTEGLTDRLPSSLKWLYLGVADDRQAETMQPLLHSLPNLLELCIHITGGVSPAAITRTLPQTRVMFLYLSDLPEGGEDRACDLIVKLQPPRGYGSLLFPRCRLTSKGWEVMVERLAQQGVGVQSVGVTDDAYLDSLKTFTRAKLGARLWRVIFLRW